MSMISPLHRQKLFHFFYSNKVKWIYLFIGIVLVLFSMQARAFSFDVSVPDNEMVLQQGSSISFDMAIYINSDHPFNISFDKQENPFVKFDGQLSPTITQDSISKMIKIVVSPSAPEGQYHLVLNVIADDGYYYIVEEKEFAVTVVKKTGSFYTTTPFTNIPPAVTNVQFSQTQFVIDRDETEFLQVSFTNSGSLTDFRVYFQREPSEFEARFENPYLLRMDQGESQQALIQIDTNSSTKLGDYLLTLLAQDVSSGKTFQLGTVAVKVESIFKGRATPQKTFYTVNEGESLSTYVVVENKSSSPQQFHLISNSALVEFQDQFVIIPAKTIQNVPFTIHGTNPGYQAVRIGLNADDDSLLADFSVKVVSDEQTPTDGSDGGITGLFGGANSIILGLIALMIIVSLYLIYKENNGKKGNGSMVVKQNELVVKETGAIVPTASNPVSVLRTNP